MWYNICVYPKIERMLPPMNQKNDKTAISFDENENLANYVFSAAMFPLALIYFEVLLHFATGMEWTRNSFMYVLFTALIVGPILYGISTIFGSKVNRVILIALTFIVGFVYAIYQVYYAFFSAFIDFGALGEAGNMFTDFFGNIVSTTLKNLHWILLFVFPSVLFFFLTKRHVRVERTGIQVKILICLFAVMLSVMQIWIVSINDDEYSDRFYYNEGFDSTISSSRFGLVTSIRLNAKYTLFGKPDIEFQGPGTTESIDLGGLFGRPNPESTTAGSATTQNPESGSGNNTETTPPPEPPFVPSDQITIDFNTLIANETNKTVKELHQYFASVTPTKTNIYTGMFEGKNLIYITAEGFTSKIIDPVLTPTLYMLQTQGFNIQNCYNSLWGGSTATGEYLAMTGLFYESAQCFKISGGANDGKARLMYYALGNTFKREGYSTLAFHNNTHTYYGRNYSHPNMGFEKFLAANSGSYTSGLAFTNNGWPRSDLEMAQISTEHFIDSENPFVAYYMTVSGHANYSWNGNRMSAKHRDKVQHLNYSDEVKAYIACNLELEYMVQNLIEQLREKGKLEDTVFVISSDHYPYGLSAEARAELFGVPLDGLENNFEIFKNSFLIWSASMKEPVIVDKYCSSMDIIPTVYNLFGIEYDSRLLMGIDVLSDSDGLVILKTHETAWNWITDYGVYSTRTKTFTPHPGITVGNEEQLKAYIKNINSIVSGKRSASISILDKDYYKYVFG